MKNKMKEYEKFIQKEIRAGNRSPELLAFHKEMVRCFQHERLVHLIIMWVFILVALGFLMLTGLLIGNLEEDWLVMWPLYLLTLILTGVSVAYVKYYYFLENHVQGLYRLTAVLSGFSEADSGIKGKKRRK